MAEENDEVRTPVYHEGPWHIVQAVLDKDETWGVNGVVERITNGQFVAFMLTDSAMHFVSFERAIDCGVWNTIAEFQEALAREEQKAAKAAAKAEAKKEDRNVGKHRHASGNRDAGRHVGGRA